MLKKMILCFCIILATLLNAVINKNQAIALIQNEILV